MNPVSLVRGNVSHPMLLAGAAFLVPLILAVLAYQVYLSYREQIRDTETRTYNYATILETRLDATLRRTDEVLQALAQSIPRRMLSRGASTRYVGDMARELDSRLPNFQELAGLRVFDDQNFHRIGPIRLPFAAR